MPLVGEKLKRSTDNFGKSVRENCLLVDKTKMIKLFIESSDEVCLVARPRRFGKTLNLSMLQHFFSANVDGESTKGLFDGFAIAKVDKGSFIETHQGKYPVIFLSLKNVKGRSFKELMVTIKDAVSALFREHKALLASDELDEDDKTLFKKYKNGSILTEELFSSLKFLSEMLYYASGRQRVIILIDEYDTPLTSAHQHQFLDKTNDFFRSFFGSALKGNNFMKKGLVTGILPVSKNDMLSGLNNVPVFTVLDAPYQQHFGFTEGETVELISKLGASSNHSELKAFYNGYNINDTMLYNPWSIMNYLVDKTLMPYWVLTAADDILRALLLTKSSAEVKTEVGNLIKGEVVNKKISTNLGYKDLIEQPDAIWALLLFCGYLTARSSRLSETGVTRTCELVIPNEEVMRLYTGIFSRWLENIVTSVDYNRFLDDLVEGRVAKFTKQLTSFMQASASGHDFRAESDYHSFTLGLLASVTGTHTLHSNKEYGTGRPDCVLIPKDKTKNLGVVLEFKHLHLKNQDDKKDIGKIKEFAKRDADGALAQIKMRGYKTAFTEHPHVTKVLKIGVVFSHRIVMTASKQVLITAAEESESSDSEVSYHEKVVSITRQVSSDTDASLEISNSMKKRKFKSGQALESSGEMTDDDVVADEDIDAEHAKKKSKKVTISSSSEQKPGLFSNRLKDVSKDDLMIANLKKTIELSTVTYNEECKRHGKKVGLRSIAGWELQDVNDKGNCFYLALSSQLKKHRQDILNKIPETTAPHDYLRLKIQGAGFKDGEWADFNEIIKAVSFLDCVLAIVDTRDPKHQFIYYYSTDFGKVSFTKNKALLPTDKAVVELAFTGNHYLSVISYPDEVALDNRATSTLLGK